MERKSIPILSSPFFVKFCALRVHAEGMLNQHYEVRITVDKVLVDQFKTPHLPEVAQELAKYNVLRSDLSEALAVIEDNGHNLVEFGTFGSVCGSRFEGEVQ